MRNVQINSTPITDTEEFYVLHSRQANLFNELMEILPPQQANKVKELLEAVVAYENLFRDAVEFNGRLYSIKKGGC